MRYRFAREGVTVMHDRNLEPGALTWDDKPIPVVWMFGAIPNRLIGKATDIRREDDGWLTAEIEWLKDTVWEHVDGVTSGKPSASPTKVERLLENKDAELSIYFSNLVEKPTAPHHILKARLLEISAIAPTGVWKKQ